MGPDLWREACAESQKWGDLGWLACTVYTVAGLRKVNLPCNFVWAAQAYSVNKYHDNLNNGRQVKGDNVMFCVSCKAITPLNARAATIILNQCSECSRIVDVNNYLTAGCRLVLKSSPP